jgi:Tfp pilus assembly protein FimT
MLPAQGGNSCPAGRESRLASVRTAFTTIEMLIVIVIVGTLMAIALPKFTYVRIDRAVSTEADQFFTLVQLAREAGMQFGRQSELHINSAAGTFMVNVDTTGEGNWGQIGFRLVDVANVAVASPDTLLCFDARGILIVAGLCQAGGISVTFRPLQFSTTDSTRVQILSAGWAVR